MYCSNLKKINVLAYSVYFAGHNHFLSHEKTGLYVAIMLANESFTGPDKKCFVIK